MKRFLLLFMFVFLTAMGANPPAGSGKDPVAPGEIDKLDKKAQDFTLRDLSGRPFSLSSLKGRVVLLNFWSTTCPPCVAEMPSFGKLYKEMRSRGLEVVAVATDRSPDDAKEFAAKKKIDFRILMDEDRAVTKKYKVFFLPTTFLIDKNGNIVEKFFGEYDWTDGDMKKKIEKLF